MTSDGRHGWHGIFTIPQTPFTEDGALDEEGLRRQIDFCVDTGTHGIVYPVMVSEFWLLSDDERKRVVDVAVEQVDGRIPMIAGVAGVSTEVAVMFSRHAREAGADGAIALPPYVLKPGLDGLVDYYRQIAEAMGKPVFIQNFDPPLGSSLPPAFIRDLLLDIPNVQVHQGRDDAPRPFGVGAAGDLRGRAARRLHRVRRTLVHRRAEPRRERHHAGLRVHRRAGPPLRALPVRRRGRRAGDPHPAVAAHQHREPARRDLLQGDPETAGPDRIDLYAGAGEPGPARPRRDRPALAGRRAIVYHAESTR